MTSLGMFYTKTLLSYSHNKTNIVKERERRQKGAKSNKTTSKNRKTKIANIVGVWVVRFLAKIVWIMFTKTTKEYFDNYYCLLVPAISIMELANYKNQHENFDLIMKYDRGSIRNVLLNL